MNQDSFDPADGCAREPLIGAITTFLSHGRANRFGGRLSGVRAMLERVIDDAGPEGLRGMNARLATSGGDWTYYERDPLARDIHRILAGPVLTDAPDITGVEHLQHVAHKRLVLFANHLSYSDANVIDVLFARAGAQRIADRMTAIAGPKVYSNVARRFSSLCYGTIKVPQSAGRASGEAIMTPREVARAARRVIATAMDRLDRGDALLVFAEGARSRSGSLQRLLPGTARYVDAPGVWIVPVALTGTERLFPIENGTIEPAAVAMHVGRPIEASALRARAGGDRGRMMDAVGLAISAMLPPAYRGAYN